jgi:Aldehyde:ferredoxin oxidoreductase
MDGWNGKTLWVDLATGRLETRTTYPKVLRSFVGGRGLNDWVLFDRIKPGIDPLGPENVLAFAVGPLTGTPLSSTSRVQVSTLSPLSGILGDGNAEGLSAFP